MLTPATIFPLGIGTFRIDLEHQEETLKGFLVSYELGQNYFDISPKYEDGKVMHFMGTVFQQLPREHIFINCKISQEVHTKEEIDIYINTCLQAMNLDYLDCLEFHAPKYAKLPLLEAYQEMKRLQTTGKIRYLGISNTTLEQLKMLNETIGIDIFDGVYNLECKTYEDIGVLEYCKNHNITFVCYQPLRRNRTAQRNYPILTALAQNYHKTQNQILLNRIIKEKGLLPLVKTTNLERITENIASLDFTLEKADYE
jgi:diketogulonate reductase-like aldo/keto reductase